MDSGRGDQCSPAGQPKPDLCLQYQQSFNGYNRRVKKTSNGKMQYSLYNAAGQLLMTDGDKGPTEYFYLGSKLVAKESQVPTSEDTPGYTGHLEDDDLQLTYMQQRYYDPLIGRFLNLGTTGAERQSAYRALFTGLISEHDIAAIRHAGNKAWVLGDEHFKAQIAAKTGRRPEPTGRGGDRKSAAFRRVQ